MEFISDRVSVEQADGRWSAVISARPSAGKRFMLLAWATAWLVCGALILYERSKLPVGEPLRQYLLALLAFWAYFMLQTGRATLWRFKGYEIWRVKDGRLTIKDSLFGFGRAHAYFAENITGVGMLNIDRRSWKWQWSDSVWMIGGERLGFEHLGKKVAFGKGLTEEEAKRLVPLLKQALRKSRDPQG
ncbi:MAG: hypothetical protein IPM12_11495 [Flavobacteriales bacterium]|nr:hypothetical protein [Flavobacteriales bacterium]